MAVLVVCVRKVRVIVTQRLMPVQAHVAQARYARQDSGVFSVMLMLVVRVVFVRVFVLQDFVRVLVFVLVAHPFPTGCLRQRARLRRARSRWRRPFRASA